MALLAALILATPVALVDFPKLPDYPAHLAAAYLIGGGANNPLLAHVYHIVWQAIPNLAAEIILPALARLMPLVTAGKLFVAATILMWALGPALIHRALYGRFGLGGLIAGAFAYNVNLMWGFLNYSFGAGLALVIFAGWIGTERRRGPLRLLLFSAAALGLYFCHIFASFVFALLVGGYELAIVLETPGIDWRKLCSRVAMVAAIFLPAGFAFFLRPQGLHASRVEFNLIDTANDKIDAILQSYFDHPAYVFLAVLLAALGVALFFRRAAIDRRMRILLVILFAASLFAPEWAMGGWGIDLRLPPVLCSVLFASTEFRLGERRSALLSAAVLCVFVYSAVVLAGNWLPFNGQVKEFRAALRTLPAGVRLMTVLDGDAIGKRSDQPYWHVAELAIIDRQAFTPLMFATPGQHVTQLVAPYNKYAALSANEGSPPDITELDDLSNGLVDGDLDIAEIFPYLMYFQCHFDEAVVIHLNGKRSPIPSILHLRHAGSFFSLYDIERSNCPKT